MKITKSSGKGSYVCPTCTIIDLDMEGTTMLTASGAQGGLTENLGNEEIFDWINSGI